MEINHQDTKEEVFMGKFLILVTALMVFFSIPSSTSGMIGDISGKAGSQELSTDPEQIKGATLLIVVEDIQPTGVTLAFSMASLVHYQGKLFLVTHNHYGNSLQDMNIVELRDAESHLIRSMYGQAFKSLIVYQDTGTTILRAPDGLGNALTPGNLVVSLKPQRGDIVQVTYRGQPDRKRVEILKAVVEEISTSCEAPVYQLQIVDGQQLLPGDSGGGVWFNGNLVANTWSILEVLVNTPSGADPASETLTNMFYAASLPDIFR